MQQPQQENNSKELYTVEEAAQYLGVTRMKIYRLLEEKELNAEINPLDKRQKLIERFQLDRLKNFKRRIGNASDSNK
jgi:hypothetical protein